MTEAMVPWARHMLLWEDTVEHALEHTWYLRYRSRIPPVVTTIFLEAA